MLTASLAVLFSLVAAPPPLSEDPAYQEGMRLYDAFEYERAIFRFKEALRIEERSDSDRATIYLRLGMTYAELRDDESAMEAFMNALEADPLLVLPDEAAPKIKALLDDARRAVRKKRETAARASQPPRSSAPGSPAPSPVPAPPASAIDGAPKARAPAPSSGASKSATGASKATADSAVSSPPAPPPSSTEPHSTALARSGPRPASAAEGTAEESDALTEESPELVSGFPWLLTAAGISGGLAAITFVAAVGSWGMGLYFVQVALAATYQDDAKIAADLAWLGQVVGQLLMIPATLLLMGAVGFGAGAYFVE